MKNILTLAGMLAVTAAILAMAYFVTRWIAQSGLSGAAGGFGDPRLCILRQLRVGRNEQLVLVRLHERCLLLGVTAGGISVLGELTPEEAAVWTAERDKASAAGQPSFLEVLQKSWAKRK